MLRLAHIAVLCLTALPWTVPHVATAGEEEISAFANQALLEKYIGPACEMVEAVTGHKFETRPSVRVSTPREVAKILAKEFEVLPEEMIPAEQRETFAKGLAEFLMAKYEPATHTIHILPSAIELVHELQDKLPKLGEDHLRVLLAHEATHALDFPHYQFMALRRELKGLDAHVALNAIVEGHAEFVSEEVAKRWALTPAFKRLEKAIVGDDDDTEGSDAARALRAAALSQVRFAYGQGHAFFTAIAKARGAEGIEAALRDPPTTTRQIENPALWLDPSAAQPEPDLRPLAESFRWLVTGPGWQAASSRVLEAALRTQALRVPASRRAEWLAGFQNARMLQGAHAEGQASFLVVAMLFDTPEHAALFAELDRLVVDGAELPEGMVFVVNEVTDGAGPQSAMPGFAMHRVLELAGKPMDFRQQVTHHGRFALEALGVNARHLERSHFDSALLRAVAWMDDPVAAGNLPALEAPQPKSKRKTLKITVTGPAGKPVPRARIQVAVHEGDTTQTTERTLEAGELALPAPRKSLRIWVSRARTAGDAPLPFAPNGGLVVAEDVEEVEIQLEVGASIRGRVLALDGSPAAGLTLQATSTWIVGDPTGAPRGVQGETVTDADGGFEIIGLANRTYQLALEKGGKRAYPEALRVEADSAPLEIRLKRMVDVTLILKAPDGSPVPGAMVSVRSQELGSLRTSVSDKEGAVPFEALDPKGEYALHVEPRESSGSVAEFRAPTWDLEDQTVRLKPGWTLRGTVTGPSGLAKAQVRLRRSKGWRAVYSGADGAFAIYGIPEGPAAVLAVTPAEESHHIADDDWTKVPQTSESVALTLFQPKQPDDETQVTKEEERAPEPAGAGK